MDSPTSQSYPSLIRNHRGLLAVAFLAVFTGNLGQSFFIGLFQVPLSQHLNLSAGEFGKIYAVITIAAGFLVMHFGPKIDWVSPKRYALLVLSALTIGLLLLTLSSWWVLGIVGLGLLRLSGQGLMTHFGFTLTGREFTLNRGRALSLMGLAMPMGEIILPSLTALLLVWLSWQQVWWSILVFITILWIALFIVVDWPAAPRLKKEADRQPILGINPMRELRFWLLIPMLSVLPMTLTGIFIYQAQLLHDLDANTTTYTLALTSMGLIRFPLGLLGGRWIDDLGINVIARLYLLPYAVALLIAALIGGNLAIWILLLGAGISMSFSSPVGDSLLVKLWGKERLGQVRSFKSAFLVFSTGIAPALIGFLLDAEIGFHHILFGMLIFLVIAWSLAQTSIRQAHQQS